MTFKRLVCIVLLATLTAVVVRPARAEAMDPNLILIIVGAGIAVIAVIAVVIIANASGARRRPPRRGAGPPLLPSRAEH